MSAETKVTERAAILRERAAFLNGIATLHIQSEIPGGSVIGRAVSRAEGKVQEFYPLPKVTRPHVMTVLDAGGYEMRVIDGVPQFRYGPLVWADLGTFGAPLLTVNGARVLVALLANPTEEVEAES